MHYVSGEGISKGYGAQTLLERISFHISEGDKIAIVARNGSGKSTLLKLLAGIDVPEEGRLWINKEVKIAWFEQEPELNDTLSVLDNIFKEGSIQHHPVIIAIREYEQALESNNPELINLCIAEMDARNAWNFESKVKEIFGKLRILRLDQKAATLSGGQRKRVALARTLIEMGFDNTHTLLLMDEPTNHLDVEMIEWLEHFLNQEKTTLLLVSHDRYFLDTVCNEIWELDRKQLLVYKGDYDNYLEKKAARMESEAASIEKAKNTYRKELEWMRKQPRARTTKSKARQDNFLDIQAKAKQNIDQAQMQLQMKMSRLGGKVVEMKKVYKSHGDLQILKGFDYTFSKGERIGIVGKNGTGKTTFLQILQQLQAPDSGKINIGDTIVFGNFSQQGLDIKDDVRVIEYVKSIAESFPLAKGGSLSATQFLELFLFSPEKQYTYLSTLSGGEKKRLQLLTVLFRNPNFLILDEPTNDLDLPTLEVLENFLDEFSGCLIIVSHDRYFMDKLVQHLFVFDGNGVITDYPGNYSQYRNWVKEKEKTTTKSKDNSSIQTTMINPVSKQKASYKEKREFELLETEINNLQTEQKKLTVELNDSQLNFEALHVISKRLEEVQYALDEKEMRWLELSEKI
jgi:ATP-binding cassette subfamily F protein uup